MRKINRNTFCQIIEVFSILFIVSSYKIYSQNKNTIHQLEILGGANISLLSNNGEKFLHIVEPSLSTGITSCYSYHLMNTFGYNYGVLYSLNIFKKMVYLKSGLSFQNRNRMLKKYPNQCALPMTNNVVYEFNLQKQLNIEIPLYLTYSLKYVEVGIGIKSALYRFRKSYTYDENNTLISFETSRGTLKSYGMSQIFRPSVWLSYKINAISKFGLSIFTNIESRDLSKFKISYFDWTIGVSFHLK